MFGLDFDMVFADFSQYGAIVLYIRSAVSNFHPPIAKISSEKQGLSLRWILQRVFVIWASVGPSQLTDLLTDGSFKDYLGVGVLPSIRKDLVDIYLRTWLPFCYSSL